MAIEGQIRDNKETNMLELYVHGRWNPICSAYDPPTQPSLSSSTTSNTTSTSSSSDPHFIGLEQQNHRSQVWGQTNTWYSSPPPQSGQYKLGIQSNKNNVGKEEDIPAYSKVRKLMII